jgi:glutamate-1-semialdehyde 2,1-aminomutase
MIYFSKLHHDLLDEGDYLGPSGYEVGFVSEAHTPEILKEAAEKICNSLVKVLAKEKVN